MNYKKALIMYMKARRDGLDLPLPHKYFNKKDEAAIGKWSEDESMRVWDTLVTRISYIQGAVGLGSTCPFCIKHNKNTSCYPCEYGKVHGTCGNHNADYLSYCLEKRRDRAGVFSNKWHRRTINRIKKECS
jgi:hypothetical protein